MRTKNVDGSDACVVAAAPIGGSEGHDKRARQRHRLGDPARVVLSLVALCVLTTSLTCVIASHLVWNRTASLPLGLYFRRTSDQVIEGDLVALRVPPRVRALVRERGYLPNTGLLIKPVAAVAGDEVCARWGVLFINGEPFGRILTHDSLGRSLPAYRGCGVLPDGWVFLASHHPRSFDSRSFGPVDIHALQGTVTPLWTY